jgi:hypothetical protein
MINRVYIPGTLHRKIDGTVELQGDRDLMQSYFLELLGIDNYCDVEICFVRSEDKKSNPQLRYFFGVVLPIIKQAFEEMQGETYSKDDIVTLLKDMYFYEEIYSPLSETAIKVPMSLEHAKKSEVAEFIDKCVNFAKDILEVDIPDSYNYVKQK